MVQAQEKRKINSNQSAYAQNGAGAHKFVGKNLMTFEDKERLKIPRKSPS